MISYDSFEWDFAIMNQINWFGEEETPTNLVAPRAPMSTSGQSAPSFRIHRTFNLVRDTLMDDQTPTVTGTVSGVALSSNGVSISTTTGTISGTPTVASPSAVCGD